MITIYTNAPNSHMLCANIINITLIILHPEISTDIANITLAGDTPIKRATFSNRSGNAANPSRDALIKN
jgi:hypothetical protein